MRNWITSKQFWRWAVLAAGPLLAALFLCSVRTVLLPFFLGGLLAYMLAPIVRRLEKRGFSRLTALLVVYASLLGLSTLLVVFGYPRVLRELSGLSSAIPTYTNKVEALILQMEQEYSRFDLPDTIREIIDQKIAGVETILLRIVHRTADALMGLAGQIISLLLAPVLAFYMLKDWEAIGAGMIGLVPKRVKLDVIDLARDIDEVVRRFIRGHVVVCTLVGSMTALGMYAIGLPFALLIGIFAGISDLIPFFGPFIGAIPALAIAVLQSWTTTLYVVLIILAVQQIEANIISPKIMGDAVGLHPIMIIFALLAGGQLWGIPGMLLALPVAAIVRVVARYVFLKLVG
ncbi:MAG TPA: AI-2E family transporter [Bacillota bacterium]|nr:AI-2E family transporter [Bacillota bacterium]